VCQIPEASQLTYNPSLGLTVGSAVEFHRIYEDQAICTAYPGLIDAAFIIGGIQIQNRATLGGNLCNSAPSADCIPPLIALDAKAVIVGPTGTREVPVSEFCIGPGKNVLTQGEFLLRITVPPPNLNSGASYLRFIPRNEMDIAVVGVGSSVMLSPKKDEFISARVAMASVAPTPVFALAAGEELIGKPVTEKSIDDASEKAMYLARPISDMRGTISQRRHLVRVLTRRTLWKAVKRAMGSNEHV
jgi:carbon-monoxide dehydrogenase medium subunit